MALKKALRTAQRKVAGGSMPIRPQMKAFLLLFSRATMSGRIWSVFFSRKSCVGIRECDRETEITEKRVCVRVRARERERENKGESVRVREREERERQRKGGSMGA
jgi:hypothetical protein